MSQSDDNGFWRHIVIAGICTLVAGCYLYNWHGQDANAEEKREWRNEHNRVLAEQFTQINQERRALNEKIEKNQEKIQQELQQQNQRLNDVLIEFMKRDMQRESREQGQASKHGR